MALVGSVAYTNRSPELLTGTWTVASGAAGGNNSAAIDCRGYKIIEFFISAITGYSSGTTTVAADLTGTGEGLLAIDPGRHIRANKTSTSLNQAGYVLYPPPTLFLSLFALGTTPTAYTVTFVARR